MTLKKLLKQFPLICEIESIKTQIIRGKCEKQNVDWKALLKKKTIHKSLHKICEINGYMKYGV